LWHSRLRAVEQVERRVRLPWEQYQEILSTKNQSARPLKPRKATTHHLSPSVDGFLLSMLFYSVAPDHVPWSSTGRAGSSRYITRGGSPPSPSSHAKHSFFTHRRAPFAPFRDALMSSIRTPPAPRPSLSPLSPLPPPFQSHQTNRPRPSAPTSHISDQAPSSP
jgi:hypothetical protein